MASVDYSAAADYMTVATRAFRIEVEEASRVTDVYSTLAASSASSTEELAIAMSKTASSAASVGASFENTTTMMAVMISATRESATNIGSAMKSIISRYGEMSSDPSKLVDAEGDAISFNKVDDALRSVGISMKDVNGQFRDFDDLIEELGSKWQSLDTLSQRYIATEFAGNRQQSRFLALVENYDLYKELQEKAMNSEDSGTLQYLKTLDSIETKIQQVKTAFQEFYTTSGLQDLIKLVLDSVTKILEKMNKMPKLFGKIPVTALSVVATLITTFKRMISNVVNFIFSKIEEVKKRVDSAVNSSGQNARAQVQGVGDAASKRVVTRGAIGNIAGMAGAALTSAGLMTEDKRKSGWLQVGGAVATGAAAGLLTPGGPIVKTLTTIASMLPGLVSGISLAFGGTSAKERTDALQQNITSSHNDTLVSKNELKTLEDYKKKLDEAKAAQYDSVEAKQEYYSIMEEIADAYPQFFSYMDAEGNKVVELGKQYEWLVKQKQEAYLSNLATEGAATIAALTDKDYIYTKAYSGDLSALGLAQIPDIYSDKTVYKDRKGNEYTRDIANTADIQSSTEHLRYTVFEDARKGKKFTIDDFMATSAYDNSEKDIIGSLTGINWNYLTDEIESGATKNLGGLLSSGAVSDQIFKAAVHAFQSAQEGINFEDFAKNNAYEAQFIVKETYAFWFDFFDKIDETNKYISSNIQAQIKQQLSVLNGIRDWGYSNAEQDYFTKEIDRVIQEQTAGIENDEERKNRIEALINEIKLLNSPEEWLKKYNNDYVNLWEGIDSITKESVDEVMAKAKDTSKAVFEKKIRNLIGEGHEDLIQSLMDDYADTVEWTTEDFTNALKEYSSQKERESVDISSFENLTPAMQQSLIASLKSADGSGNAELVTATENLYAFLNSLDEVQMGIASEIIKSADLTTIAGLRKFRQDMAKNNIDVSKQVDELKSATNFNLITEIGEYVSTVSEQLDDYEKFLSSAEKGMSFKDANTAAQKMGLDVTKDFTFDNGAYFLNNFEKIREIYAKSYQDLMDEYEKEYRREIGEIEAELSNVWMETPENKNRINELEQRRKDIKDAYDEAQEMTSNAVDYLFNTFLISAGEFSNFVESIGIENADNVAQMMRQGDIEGVKKALGDQWNTYGSAIVEAISNSSYDLMSNLIKGIESGEIFALTQEQYQSIAGDERLQKAFNVIVDSTNGKVSLQMVNLAEAWGYIQELLDKGIIKNVKQYNEVAKQIASYEEARNTPVATLLDSFKNLYHITDTELIEYADKIGVDSKKFIDAWNNSAELDAVPRLLYAARAAGASVNRTTEDVRAVLLKYDDLFEEVSNAMQKGTQGASFSEAVSIAEQLGKDVEDLFELRGTELVFKDLQDFSSIYSMYIDKLASLGYKISPLAQQYAQSLASNDLIENGQWTEALRAAESGVDNRAQLEPALRDAVEGVFSSIGENIVNGVSIIAEDSNREILQNLAGMGIVKEVANDVYKVVEGKQGDFLRAVAGAEALTVEQQMSILEESINNLSTEMYSGDLLATLSQMAKEATGKMKDKILEMMQSLLGNITSAITNGISGSASASDISNLETQLGVSIKTDRTAEGYKIQQNSLYDVYNAVKDIDTIAAQTVLTALAESAQTSDERLNDVFYVMERIKDINDELAKPDISDARRKKLQAELDIAEELQKQLKEADNTFDFMSRDLASGFDDPLSAWKGMGTAGEVLNSDDYARGLVGFQDFSNMISFMGDDVLREAGILNDKSQTASDLILAASSALKNVGGETFVDLSALGANFNTGSEAMKEGLMKGVQNLAKSQIEIIDAEIKVLETVVNSQEAFEKLKGDKTELTADDLLPNFGDADSVDNYRESLQGIAPFVQGYLFECGKTINEIIANPATWQDLTLNDRAFLAALMNNVLGGEDWKTLGDDLKQQVVDKLNAAFEESGINKKAELVVGSDGLVISFADTTKEAMDDAASATSELDDNISALQDTVEANNPFQPWETTLANCEASIARINNYISSNGSFSGNGGQSGGSGSVNNRSNQKSNRFSAVAYDDGGVSTATKSLQNAQTTIVDSLDAAIAKLNELAQVVANIPDKAAEVNKLVSAINRLRSKTLSLSATISLDIETTGANVNRIRTNVRSGSSKTGVENIKAKVAAAKGTLMGELGPEIVVSNGRYFMVGQNGAEFVNLDKDAIVFNHLQTRQLMSTGLTSRGIAYTNEKNATSYAKGNATGPAMASAADALAELRKIRAQWQELLDSPASALGAKAGSGGGGGGGGKNLTAQIHDIERWYNLLRQIEKYEQKITYEQQKRNN